jgi:hypothetical protein
MGKAIIGEHSISCIRGPLSKMNSIFKDNSGNEWYCKHTRHMFEQLPDTACIEAFNKKGSLVKKYVKSYLVFVKELGEEETVVAEVVTTPVVEVVKRHKRKEVVTEEEPVERETGEVEESEETHEVGAQPPELATNESGDE